MGPGDLNTEEALGQYGPGSVLHLTRIQRAGVILLLGVALGSRGGVRGHLRSQSTGQPVGGLMTKELVGRRRMKSSWDL